MANDPVPGTDAAYLKTIGDQLAAGITATIDESTLSTSAKQDTTNTEIGATNEGAAGTDTATSGLNGLIKRLLARIALLISPNVSPVTQIMTIGTGTGVVIPNVSQGSSAALANRRELFLRALTSNTGILFIGSSTVTADEAATGGKKLFPGDEMSDNLGTGSLYVTSDTAGQKLFVYER